MVVPRPVPPKRREVDSSACVKLSKMRACASAGMPMPVSRIENLSRTLFSVSEWAETCTVTLPRSVNLTALPARLMTIWRRWCGSPRTAGGTSGMIETTNSMPLRGRLRGDDAAGAVDERVQVEVGLLERSLPASILEKSSTSSTRPSSTREEPRSVCSMSACSRVSVVSRSRSAMPMMALSGVRISWLITEMKRRFATFAASARARASNMRRTSDSTYMLTNSIPSSIPMPSAVCSRHQGFR